ncbi:hypothetical protein F0L17_17505 [Streptomyces sp. TRM43335]|uniref:Integral membrane protein n=1 Tax=Streptomyces taklimakanensis TaxID=2569853 RepID=A0A6G2BF63_9ACTN|nr:hypothetical protein [Streptomyces taklimakanensis]MTE20880.1 hypothetical protein [Streptomyces taklimakanensis]
MPWEVLGSALLGLVVAVVAAHRFPDRFRDRALVLATGPAAAFVGGMVTRVVLGPGHPLPTLAVAVPVSAALLSLLVRPGGEAPPRGRPRVGAA